jgi:hypothetical protein
LPGCAGRTASREVAVAERVGLKRLSFVGKRGNLQTMSIHARTSYRGYRYYRLPNGTPEAAARV